MRRVLPLIVVLASRSAMAEPTRDAAPASLVAVGDAVGVATLAGGYAVLRLSSDRNCDVCAGDFGILMMALGASWYVGFAPIRHHERGRDGRAWLSGTLRLGLPVIAGLATSELTHREGPILGAIGATMIGAMVFDWTVLAREPRPSTIVFGAPVVRGAVVGLAKTW